MYFKSDAAMSMTQDGQPREIAVTTSRFSRISKQPSTTEKKELQAEVKRVTLLSFGAWWVLLVSGYFYVAGILCQRDNPFQSGNPGAGDFVLVVLLSPFLFCLSPRHNWNPTRFSASSILKWNGVCYLLPFFLVLHWEFLGHAIGAQFSLTAADLGSLDSPSRVALVVAFTVIAGLMACHLAWARRTGILFSYTIALCGVPCIIGIITLVLGDTHYLHVHHYFLGAFLFPFFRFRNVPSFVAQALFLGLAVEGISRWGMDPMWYSSVP